MRMFVCKLMLALFSSALFAQESPFRFNVWGECIHLGSGTPGFKRNENNLGLGVRYDVWETTSGGQFFADANAFKNSTYGLSICYGAGYEHPFTSIGRIQVLWGTVVGVEQYENKWKNKIFIRPGFYPFLGFREKNITLNLGYLPGSPGVLFVYASIRL